jgi:hypothetical protein
MARQDKAEQIAVALPPGLRKAAKLAAIRKGTSIAAIVRDALKRFVQGGAK